MRRMMLELVLAAVAAAIVAAASIAVAHAGNPTETPTPDASGVATATPTEEPELTVPTPSSIEPPAYGDPAASRLLLVGGVYEIPPQNDCGWAETRREQVLYRNYETSEVVVLTAPCPGEDIFIFYPVSGELQRQREDTPRLHIQLVDGKVTIDPGDGCVFEEFTRATIPYGPEQQPTEVVQLGSVGSCVADYGYTYIPATGEIAIWAPSVAPTPTPTPGSGITLPNTGGGMPVAPATTWIYVGNALVAGAIALAGLLVATRRR
jgi:hypothetical protein